MSVNQPDPFVPAPYTDSVVAALQALEKGQANEGQQKLALDWIITGAADAYNLEYRTDSRDHAFASGRRFVGLQIVTALKINLAKVAEAAKRIKKQKPTST